MCPTAVTWFATLNHTALGLCHISLVQISLFFSHASCPCLTSCAGMPGGLLRKPPLKGARITYVARISSICSLNTNTYRCPGPTVQCAYLPAHYAQGLRIRARSSCARKATCSSTVWSTSSGLQLAVAPLCGLLLLASGWFTSLLVVALWLYLPVGATV